jgi:uncharacterized repeat protein (TIGR03803 family)
MKMAAGHYDCLLKAHSRWILITLVAAGLLAWGKMSGQTLHTIYTFSPSPGVFPNLTNFDGASPQAGVILVADSLYGTAYTGGACGVGTIFCLNTNDNSFTVLHSFDGLINGTNSDGAWSTAALTFGGSQLYGTASSGGASGTGNLFKLNRDGTGFTNLYSLDPIAPFSPPQNYDGATPLAAVLVASNTVYGTADLGGMTAGGALYGMETDSTNFTVLHYFSSPRPPYPDNGGARPRSKLVINSGVLYGTASQGGAWLCGTIFAANTDGTGFTTLHDFTPGFDGQSPNCGLTACSNMLFGATSVGGWGGGGGTIFCATMDGSNFKILHAFGTLDGSSPSGPLVLLSNRLYGCTASGGCYDAGTIFTINTDGTGFRTLYCFTGGADGGNPSGTMAFDGNRLFGTTRNGGAGSNGTVFILSLGPVSNTRPQLTIGQIVGNVVLSWPSDEGSFSLQTTTDPGSPSSWTTVCPPPIELNGQNLVTNAASSHVQFYRLMH